MRIPLREYSADHRFLLDAVARAAGFSDPVAVQLGAFTGPVLKKAIKGRLVPIDGCLVRNWNPDASGCDPGVELGARLYTLAGVRFARIEFRHDDNHNMWGLSFAAVDRRDYRQFYRVAVRCRRHEEVASPAPLLAGDQADVLWKNTIGYLDPVNLQRIKAYGGRARRGVLLTGSPGNGKTMACRWIWEECRRRGWDWRLVSPDDYRSARANPCDATEAVRELFAVQNRGVVFFDDLDIALRDRETVHETDDQAVFLTALDGIAVNEGVVFVFTTNCSLDLIDRAFKRPGRIDLVLHFKEPSATLRRQLIERWHTDIRAHLDLDTAVASTDGYSFAEIEELKNLLVMHFMDTGLWEWGWALKQFDANRSELNGRARRRLGFCATALHDEANAE